MGGDGGTSLAEKLCRLGESAAGGGGGTTTDIDRLARREGGGEPPAGAVVVVIAVVDNGARSSCSRAAAIIEPPITESFVGVEGSASAMSASVAFVRRAASRVRAAAGCDADIDGHPPPAEAAPRGSGLEGTDAEVSLCAR